MNGLHRKLCSSAKWKEVVQRCALPWTIEQIDLGSEALEIGPGYGAATEVLRQQVRHLTCVESDRNLADGLRRKLNGKVTVRCEDATAVSLPGASFDSAVCFTMLHHIGSAELQNKLFAEVSRVLRPGGTFAGTDSLKSRSMGLIHLFDTLVLVNPERLPQWLTAAGFENVRVDVNPYAFRFRAWKPWRPIQPKFLVRSAYLARPWLTGWHGYQ
jgi:SAM-dependent methyltransferase